MNFQTYTKNEHDQIYERGADIADATETTAQKVALMEEHSANGGIVIADEDGIKALAFDGQMIVNLLPNDE